MAFTKITGPGIHTLTNIVSHNVKSSGIITAVNGNLNGWLAVGSTASFSGNVSIGGTLTYDDVTNVESVGLITAKAGIFIPDDQKLELGNAAGSGDLSLFYDSTPGESLISHTGPGVLKIEGNSSNNIFIRPKSGENSILAKPNAEVELYYDNELRFRTSGVGATIRDSAASGSGISNSLDLLNIGNNNGDGSSISFLRSPGNTRAQIIAVKNETSNNETDLVFKTTKNGGTLTESLRILGNTQRVGIGTTIPNAPIHIQSSENTLGILTSTDDGANLDLSDNDTMTRIRSVDGRLHLYADFGSSVSGSSIRFFVDGSSEKVRFTNTGRVGIGTTNPTRNLQIGHLQVDANNVIRLGRRIASQNTNLPLIGHHSGDGTGSGLALCATSTNGAIHFFTGNGGNGFGANDNQERVIIRHDGKVGIGTTIPHERLHIHEGDVVIGQTSGNNTDIRNYIKFGRVDAPKAAIGFINTTGNGRGDILFMNSDASNANAFSDSEEVVRITHEGEVLINEGSPRSYVDGAGNTQTPKLQVEADDNTSSAISLTYNSGSGAANRRASFMFARTADGTVVADDSVLGEVLFMGEANSTLEKAASIRAEVDGNVGINSMPGRLVFSTTAEGSDSPTQRLHITNDGLIGIGLANPTFKLHVYGGNMRVAQPAGTESILDIQEGTTTNPLRLKQTATEARIQNVASLPFNIRSQSGSGSTAHLAFWTRDSERLRIKADGKVGIGTTNAESRLTVAGTSGTTQIEIKRLNSNATGTVGALNFTAFDGHSVANISAVGDGDNEGAHLVFRTTSAAGEHSPFGGSTIEALRIDSSRRILIGRTSNHTGTGTNPIVQIQSTSTNNYGRIEIAYAGGNTLGPAVYFVKARGNTADSNTAAGSADQCGALFFLAADGNDRNNRVASIQAYTDGSITSNITPGKLVFRTTPDNDNATLERLTINSSGIVQLNTANKTYIRGGIYAKYTGASGDTANINTSSAGKVSWLQTNTEIFENGGFTNTATDVTVPFAGIYQVIFNGYLESSDIRTNVRFRYRINGTDSNEDLSLNNYIRRDSGHNESSVNFIAYLNLSAGDTVAVSAQAVGASGTVTMLKDHSSLTFHLVA